MTENWFLDENEATLSSHCSPVLRNNFFLAIDM